MEGGREAGRKDTGREGGEGGREGGGREEEGGGQGEVVRRE